MNNSDTIPAGSDLRVKILSRLPAELWRHQLPDGEPYFNHCHFIFDRNETNYDWLVVYDDFPVLNVKKNGAAVEQLCCPQSHTLLVTTEPSSIKSYSKDYTYQFGAVLTSQAEWALPHPQRIYSQPALHWYYGLAKDQYITFREMETNRGVIKSSDVSMVFSPKRQKHTLHHKRFDFMKGLMERVPEMDVYGRGARPLKDKADALNQYRYHVTIENYIGPHHWTEKLADAYLGLCLPFYCGCTNVEDYFPEDSYIMVDMHDPAGAADIIRKAILDNEYDKRLPALIEAKRRVLYEYNFFSVLSREIQARHVAGVPLGNSDRIYSRHAVRQLSYRHFLRDIYGKLRSRAYHAFNTSA